MKNNLHGVLEHEQEVTDSKGQQLIAHEIAQNKFVLSSRYLQVARATVAIIKH